MIKCKNINSKYMEERFYHYPDDTIFHKNREGQKAFTFADCRALTNDNQKIEKLRERINTYYIDGLIELKNPFTVAIVTCVGIEILGQIMLGFDKKGETIDENTIEVYKMLDTKVALRPSSIFKSNYNRHRSMPGQIKDFASNFDSYAHIIRKGLRNAFSHTYRSLGVVLSDSLDDIMSFDEDKGLVIVNPYIFRQKFHVLYEECFSKALSNSMPDYRKRSLLYLELLLR